MDDVKTKRLISHAQNNHYKRKHKMTLNAVMGQDSENPTPTPDKEPDLY